jgi:hypothetical protein
MNWQVARSKIRALSSSGLKLEPKPFAANSDALAAPRIHVDGAPSAR